MAITLLLTFKYGYIGNIKVMIISFIYFFGIVGLFINADSKIIIKLRDTFFITISVIMSFTAIVSIIQFLAFIKYRSYYYYNGAMLRQGFYQSRLFGIFVDPNIASTVFIIVIVYLSYMLVISRKFTKKPIKILFMLFILVDYIYIVLAQSRTAKVTITIILLLACYLYDNKSISKVFLRYAVCLAVLFISMFAIKESGKLYISSFNATYNEENKNTNFSLDRDDTRIDNISNNRFQIWSGGIELIAQRPLFGYSSENWYPIAKNSNPDNYVVKENYRMHNGYLEIILNNGFVGFVIFGLFIVRVLYLLIKYIHNNFDKSEPKIILIILATLLVTNMFISYTLYGISILGYILFLLISRIFSFSEDHKEEDSYNCK